MRILSHFFILFLFSSTLFASPASIETADLANIIDQKKIVLVDMSSDKTQYQRFHIPNAIYMPYALFKDKKGRAISPQKLAFLLGYFGISTTDYVIAYDDMGGLNAGRLFWALENIGHSQVSVLNGGLVQWILEQRKVDNQPHHRAKVQYQLKAQTQPNLALVQDMLKAIQNKAAILDVRSKAEYQGSKKTRSGHIPTAQLWTWNQHVDFNQGFKLKSAQTLTQSLASLGIKNKKDTIFVYCQSGHRASQAYWSLRALGYQNVKLYDASIKEWTALPQLPLTKGLKP